MSRITPAVEELLKQVHRLAESLGSARTKAL
jgi:hypothetical protein